MRTTMKMSSMSRVGLLRTPTPMISMNYLPVRQRTTDDIGSWTEDVRWKQVLMLKNKLRFCDNDMPTRTDPEEAWEILPWYQDDSYFPVLMIRVFGLSGVRRARKERQSSQS
jgi:hypothetical protein